MPKKTNGIKLLKYADTFLSFNASETIFKEGEDGKQMFVVKSGVAELHVAGVVIETLEAGDIVGEMALLDNHCRSATAIALTDCQLVPIDSERFEYLIRQTPNFAIEVMQVMAERLRRMNRQTQVIGRKAES